MGWLDEQEEVGPNCIVVLVVVQEFMARFVFTSCQGYIYSPS